MSGPVHGRPVQADVLAGADCARPRHGTDDCAGHLGAHDSAQGDGPAGACTLGILQAGLAVPGGWWQCLGGWWQWAMPRTGVTVHLVHTSKEYVEHLFRESLREAQLTALEERRLRTFGGMGARLHRELTLSGLTSRTTELDKSLLRGALASALWTADRAYRRGLRADGRCPYCDKGVWKDESHLLWWCGAWKVAREPFLSDIMLLARALKLGALSEWPPCLRLCGLLPEFVVT